MQSFTIKKTKYIFLAVGCIILAVLFKSFGIQSTIEHIKSLGWFFVLVCSVHIVSNGGMAYAWSLFLPCRKLRYMPTIFCARVAGDATASINALGAFAGEPIKALYLRDIVPFQTGLASVILDRTIHSIAVTLIFMTGIIIGLFVLDLPLAFSISGMVVMLILIIFLFYIVAKQKDGFITFILSKLPKFIVNKFMTQSRMDKVKLLDEELSGLLLPQNRFKFVASLFLHYAVTLTISTLEIYIIVIMSEAVGGQFSFFEAMFVYVFGFILTSAMFFMPANIGTSEGSYSLAFKMLGFDPALGLSLGIIRRLRTFVWSGIGIIFLFYAGLIKRQDNS